MPTPTLRLEPSDPLTSGLNAPRRSLDEYLAELVERFDALAPQAHGRADLARRIREVEIEIGARSAPRKVATILPAA